MSHLRFFEYRVTMTNMAHDESEVRIRTGFR
jgi:hypothetical protein